MMRLVLFFIVAMLTSAGWCEPTFDTSPGNAQISVDAMKAEMTDAEKAELDAAIRVIDMAINSIMWEVSLDEKDSAIAKLSKIFLNGKTASEFLDTADRACGVFHPNEFMVQMVCEKLREAAADAMRKATTGAAQSDPSRVAQRQEEDAIGGDGSGQPKEGESFRDCPDCPEMVVIPAGRFRMGGLVGGGGDDEKPMREVEIQRSFALGKYEVTVGEFRHFVLAADYRTHAERHPEEGCYTLEMPVAKAWSWTPWRSWQNLAYEIADEQPVVCVNLEDVQAYVTWLSERTGQLYRLPSEAEWEYAARSGSETIYHFGNDDTLLCEYGNVQDETDFPHGAGWADAVECSDGAVFPTPVGSYAPNAWDLYDTIGNAWEWTADCWNADYPLGTPDDGRADVQGNCSSRILRGGSWSNAPLNLGSAYRNGGAANSSSDQAGFRVVRMLTP